MSADPKTPQTIAIIGGGPAGLFAAETLIEADLRVVIYDAMPSVGRKFLIAGKGGLNLTHAEPFDDFLSRFGSRRPQLEPHLRAFGPEQLREWFHALGFETFVGSSGRVFPKDMNAGAILHAWRERLQSAGVDFHLRHRWLGWGDDTGLRFDTPDGEIEIQPDAVILALGGASWPQTGSTGAWAEIFSEAGIALAPFRPANCGFDVDWTDHLRNKFSGQPIKPVTLTFTPAGGKAQTRQGEFIVTEDGVEGSLIYAFSAPLRDEIEAHGSATPTLDLAPDWSKDRLRAALSKPRGSRSLSSHIKKTIGLHGVKTGLLYEFLSKEIMNNPAKLAAAIKHIPLPLTAPRPIAEAISTAGGLSFDALDEHLMLQSIPGVFCAGEMLDWEAPTGGYLLTASFATGKAAAEGVLGWLGDK